MIVVEEGWRSVQASKTHRRVDDLVGARAVVDVDRHTSQRRHLGRQLVQALIVLALAIVTLGHFKGEVKCGFTWGSRGVDRGVFWTIWAGPKQGQMAQ